MKSSLITQVLVILLLADAGAFAVAGFGTGALCVGTCPSTFSPLTQTTVGLGAIQSYISISTPNPISDVYSASGTGMQSTSVSFSIGFNINNSAGTCSNNPAWAAGSGYYYGFFVISLHNGSSTDPIAITNLTTQGGGVLSTGPVAGQATWGSVYNYYVLSENNSAVNSAWCYGAPGYSAQGGGGFFWPTTFYFNGRYTDHTIVNVQFVTEYDNCNGNAFSNSGGQGSHPCGFGSASLFPNKVVLANTGPIGQTYLLGGFSFLSPQQGLAVNGGTLIVPYVTGYDGANTFSAQFIFGPCTSNPGAIIQTISNIPQASGGLLNFNVPAGTAQNISPSSCAAPYTPNTFIVVLFNGWVATAAIWRQLVDISYAAAPGVPLISATDVQGHSPAVQGDTIQLTLSASWTPTSGKIVDFDIAGYYNAGETTPPVAGQYWIGGNPQGYQVATGCTGNATAGGVCTATYQFQVAMTASVSVIVQDTTAQGQNNQAQYVVQVNPTGCGSPGCGSGGPSHPGLWAWLGPVFLEVGIALATAIAFVNVPADPKWYALIAVVAAVAIAGSYELLVPQFAPGGALA